MDDVIGRLLRAGLLTHLGDEEERVERLRAASAKLAEDYAGPDRDAVPSALFAAVDETGAGDDSILVKARECIIEEWETFANAYAQRDPAEVLRAVTFDAVMRAAADDPDIQIAAWYALRNAAERVDVGRWNGELTAIIDEIAYLVRERIEDLWLPGDASSSLRMPSVPEPGGSGEGLQVAGLEEVKSTISGQNPQQIAQTLGQRLPDLVENLVQAVASHTEAASAAQTEQLKEVVSSLGGKLRVVLELHERTLAAVARRDRLLWWRLAGRSQLLGVKYEQAAGPASAAVAAAFDLLDSVPEVAPVAVEHLLLDVLEGSGMADTEVSVEELREACRVLEVTVPTAGREPPLLIDVIVNGVDPAAMCGGMQDAFTCGEAAVVLFRDLQIRRLLTSATPDKGDQ